MAVVLENRIISDADRKVFNWLLDRMTAAREAHNKPSFAALMSEVGELSDELVRIEAGKEPTAYYKDRMVQECIDVAVVALRMATEEFL